MLKGSVSQNIFNRACSSIPTVGGTKRHRPTEILFKAFHSDISCLQCDFQVIQINSTWCLHWRVCSFFLKNPGGQLWIWICCQFLDDPPICLPDHQEKHVHITIAKQPQHWIERRLKGTQFLFDELVNGSADAPSIRFNPVVAQYIIRLVPPYICVSFHADQLTMSAWHGERLVNSSNSVVSSSTHSSPREYCQPFWGGRSVVSIFISWGNSFHGTHWCLPRTRP